VWLLGLGVVVGLAVIGGTGQTGAARSVPAAVGPVTPAVAATLPKEHIIVLDSPAIQNAEITSRDLVVRGHLKASTGAGPVSIVLESSGSKVLSLRTVYPVLVPWAVDPEDRSVFRATFPLSNPRPGGRMVIQVIAYDSAGTPLDSVRRRIRIGAVLVDGPPPAGPHATPGDPTATP
jgi:hypothetical protein